MIGAGEQKPNPPPLPINQISSQTPKSRTHSVSPLSYNYRLDSVYEEEPKFLSMKRKIDNTVPLNNFETQDLVYFYWKLRDHTYYAAIQYDYYEATSSEKILKRIENELKKRGQVLSNSNTSYQSSYNTIEELNAELKYQKELFNNESEKRKQRLNDLHTKEISDFKLSWQDEKLRPFRIPSTKIKTLLYTEKHYNDIGEYDAAGRVHEEILQLIDEETKSQQIIIQKQYNEELKKLKQKQERESELLKEQIHQERCLLESQQKGERLRFEYRQKVIKEKEHRNSVISARNDRNKSVSSINTSRPYIKREFGTDTSTLKLPIQSPTSGRNLPTLGHSQTLSRTAGGTSRSIKVSPKKNWRRSISSLFADGSEPADVSSMTNESDFFSQQSTTKTDQTSIVTFEVAEKQDDDFYVTTKVPDLNVSSAKYSDQKPEDFSIASELKDIIGGIVDVEFPEKAPTKRRRVKKYRRIDRLNISDNSDEVIHEYDSYYSYDEAESDEKDRDSEREKANGKKFVLVKKHKRVRKQISGNNVESEKETSRRVSVKDSSEAEKGKKNYNEIFIGGESEPESSQIQNETKEVRNSENNEKSNGNIDSNDGSKDIYNSSKEKTKEILEDKESQDENKDKDNKEGINESTKEGDNISDENKTKSDKEFADVSKNESDEKRKEDLNDDENISNSDKSEISKEKKDINEETNNKSSESINETSNEKQPIEVNESIGEKKNETESKENKSTEDNKELIEEKIKSSDEKNDETKSNGEKESAEGNNNEIKSKEKELSEENKELIEEKKENSDEKNDEVKPNEEKESIEENEKASDEKKDEKESTEKQSGVDFSDKDIHPNNVLAQNESGNEVNREQKPKKRVKRIRITKSDGGSPTISDYYETVDSSNEEEERKEDGENIDNLISSSDHSTPQQTEAIESSPIIQYSSNSQKSDESSDSSFAGDHRGMHRVKVIHKRKKSVDVEMTKREARIEKEPHTSSSSYSDGDELVTVRKEVDEYYSAYSYEPIEAITVEAIEEPASEEIEFIEEEEIEYIEEEEEENKAEDSSFGSPPSDAEAEFWRQEARKKKMKEESVMTESSIFNQSENSFVAGRKRMRKLTEQSFIRDEESSFASNIGHPRFNFADEGEWTPSPLRGHSPVRETGRANEDIALLSDGFEEVEGGAKLIFFSPTNQKIRAAVDSDDAHKMVLEDMANPDLQPRQPSLSPSAGSPLGLRSSIVGRLRIDTSVRGGDVNSIASPIPMQSARSVASRSSRRGIPKPRLSYDSKVYKK